MTTPSTLCASRPSRRTSHGPLVLGLWTAGALSLAGTGSAWAQALTGSVVGPQQQAIEFATVRLHRPHETTPVAALSADEAGRFHFDDVKAGKYLLIASAMGWQTDSVTIEAPVTGAVTIRLQNAKTLLQEVFVRGEKPLIEKRADRLIYNVGNSLTAETSTLWESLRKAPLVQTDEQAGLSIRNTPGVSVYINDRRVYLSGEALTQYLQSIRASDVARIEVITTPPARYDAEGNSGVLNIVLKTSPTVGLNGSAQATYIQTRYGKLNSGLNLNYRQGKLNVYGSGTAAGGRYYRREDYSQQYQRTSYEESLRYLSDQRTGSARLGLDFFATKRHTLGLLVQANWTGTDARNTNQGTFGREARADSTILGNVAQQQASHTYTVNANYQVKLDSTGQLLTVDADVVRFGVPENTAVNYNNTYDGAGNLLRQVDFSNGVVRNITIRALKTDYERPIAGAGTLSLGAKIVRTTTNNRFVFTPLRNAGALADSLPTADFAYTEQIGAAYSSYKQKVGKWDLQLGLRGEWTAAKGSSPDRTIFERNYFKLFPTVYAEYSPSEAAQYIFNYSRRIARPDFNAVNPFRSYVNPYSYYVGNPLLQPAFTHAFELAMLYKSAYNFSVFYKATDGRQTQIPIQDQATNSYRMVYANIDRSGSYGADVSFSQRLTGWWETSTTLSGMMVYSRSRLLASEFRMRGFYYNLASSHAFTLSPDKTLRGEVNFFYAPPGNIQGLFKLGQQVSLDATISKQLFDKRLVLTLTGTDLFNQAYVPARVAYLDQRSLTTGFLDRRGVRLGLRYKFGKASVKDSRRRDTSTSAEKNRL